MPVASRIALLPTALALGCAATAAGATGDPPAAFAAAWADRQPAAEGAGRSPTAIASGHVRLIAPADAVARHGLPRLRDLADRAAIALDRIAELTGLAPPGAGSLDIVLDAVDAAGHARLGGRGIRIAPGLLDAIDADPAAWDAAIVHELSHNADHWAGAPFSDRWFAGPDPAHAWTDFLTAYLLPAFACDGDPSEGLPPADALAAAIRRSLGRWQHAGGAWSGDALTDAQTGLLLSLAERHGPAAVRAACAAARRRPPAADPAERTAALIADWSAATGRDLRPWFAARGVPVAGLDGPVEAVPLASPDGLTAVLGSGDGDRWPLDILAAGRYRIELRSPPGGAAGWLGIDAGGWSHRRWCLSGDETAVTAYLPAGRCLISVDAGDGGRPGPYALVSGPAPAWPPAAAAPLAVALGDGRSLVAAGTAPVDGPGLCARWWVSGRGWIGATPAIAGCALPVVIDAADLPPSSAIRVQWYRGDAPAWPISAAAALTPAAPTGVN